MSKQIKLQESQVKNTFDQKQREKEDEFIK
jgi:hypothetical protein